MDSCHQCDGAEGSLQHCHGQQPELGTALQVEVHHDSMQKCNHFLFHFHIPFLDSPKICFF